MRLLIIIFTVLSFNTKACTCAAQSKMTVEDFNSSSVIFKGVIQSIEIDTSNLNLIAVFKVLTHYKGEESEIIKVFTINDEGMCGLSFKPGQKWYIQTRLYDGSNWASLCSRSKQLSKPNYYFDIREIKYYFIVRKYHRKTKRRVRQDVRFVRKIERRGN